MIGCLTETTTCVLVFKYSVNFENNYNFADSEGNYFDCPLKLAQKKLIDIVRTTANSN